MVPVAIWKRRQELIDEDMRKGAIVLMILKSAGLRGDVFDMLSIHQEAVVNIVHVVSVYETGKKLDIGVLCMVCCHDGAMMLAARIMASVLSRLECESCD